MMSFLDKMTKAVGDVVDKGKKDVDQFMKIQKINGEISAMEKKIAGFKTHIEQAKVEAGSKAIELLRAGMLSSAALQPFLEQVTGFEQQIAAEEASIAGKKVEIEKVKAEHEAEHATVASQVAQPVVPPPVPAASATPPPPAPASAAAEKVCTQCGAQLTGGAFCPACGAKQG
jgi:chromosome segregation ATPase